VCVGEQPLHAVPLLQFHNKRRGVASNDFSMPHWINLSFYSSSKRIGYSTFLPRIKMAPIINKEPTLHKNKTAGISISVDIKIINIHLIIFSISIKDCCRQKLLVLSKMIAPCLIQCSIMTRTTLRFFLCPLHELAKYLPSLKYFLNTGFFKLYFTSFFRFKLYYVTLAIERIMFLQTIQIVLTRPVAMSRKVGI